MKATDVMTTDVVTVTPETSVVEIAKLLMSHRIGGLPVVDAAGNLVGMVSDGDLMRRSEVGTLEPGRPWWLSLFVDKFREAAKYVKTHGHTAGDVMTKKVLTVTEDTPLAEIARILETHRIKRVPVLRDGKIVGIVSRANLAQGLAAMGAALPQNSITDQELRKRAIAAVKGEPWATLRTTNITVVDGVIELWGLVFEDVERDAWRVAMDSVRGAKQVVDRRMMMPKMSELIFGSRHVD
jgi:CBS domain-containing protein